jgi:restriction system protein
MKPSEFEKYIAEYYQRLGYIVQVTPLTGDYGVDVIAIKGEEKIAIQAKMYGNSTRKVNRETIMQLYGAMAYRQCNKAVIATDGECMNDAVEVAKSLGVEILYLDSASSSISKETEIIQNSVPVMNNLAKPVIPFDEMWEKYIMPLSGKEITNDGLTNKIISVDWGGLKRMSSNGRVSKIRIEEFRIAYGFLLTDGSVERELINQHANRCSSAIFLVLAQIPFIGVQNRPKKLYLK